MLLTFVLSLEGSSGDVGARREEASIEQPIGRLVKEDGGERCRTALCRKSFDRPGLKRCASYFFLQIFHLSSLV